MKRSFLISLLFLLSASPAWAYLNRVGNGGGAWTCRNYISKDFRNTQVTWIAQIDLYEATSQYGLRLKNYSGGYKKIVKQITRRLNALPGNPFEGLQTFLDNVNNLKPGPNVTYLETNLAIINDALYFAVPLASSCPNGIIRYEQVVNYDNHGFIFIQRNLFNALSDRDKAALILHEAIYAYRRSLGDTDSLNSRRMVGLAFSDINYSEFVWHLGFLTRDTAYIYPPSYNIYVKIVQDNGSVSPLWSIPLKLTGSFTPNSDKITTLEALTDHDGYAFIVADKRNVFRSSPPNLSVQLGDGNTYSGPLNANGWARRLSPTLFSQNPKYSCETMSFVGSNNIQVICVNHPTD
jgi:hypothetical protein